MVEDIRWIQRFSNFKRAFKQVLEAQNLAAKRELSQLEKQGLIQAFEFTHELAWKSLKDFLQDRGHTTPIYGSKDATRQAFAKGLLDNAEVWMRMIRSRNLTSHIYDEAAVAAIADEILRDYVAAFAALAVTLEQLAQTQTEIK